MSELSRRLRDAAKAYPSSIPPARHLYGKAADRIEQLEASLRVAADRIEALDLSAGNVGAITTLMIHHMFADHELPVDDAVLYKYEDLAHKILIHLTQSTQAAARIEALENALRQIVALDQTIVPAKDRLAIARSLAHAALAPEQDK